MVVVWAAKKVDLTVERMAEPKAHQWDDWMVVTKVATKVEKMVE